MHFRERNQGLQQATRNTQDCESICIETIQHCLDVGGSHTEPSHVRLLQDCADICDTSTKFLLRTSPQHEQLLAACANLCDLCAASCERFPGDAQMKACANQCRLCASACRQMISGAAGLQGAGLRGDGVQGGTYQGVGAHGAMAHGSR